MEWILYSIIIGVAIGSIIGIFAGYARFRTGEKNKYTTGPLSEIARELENKRNQIREMYPSNISWRGFISDTNNTFPNNQIVYMVAEGDFLFFVYDDDMKTKFNIPIIDIVEFEKVKLTDLSKIPALIIPDIKPSAFLPVFKISYKNDEKRIISLYFFYESAEISTIYNKNIPGQKSVYFYVKSYKQKRKK